MKQPLIRIYALIMLECRLSLKDASTLFKIEEPSLEIALTDPSLPKIIINAIKYLIYYEALDTYDDKNKNLFKAKLYLRKLDKILREKDKETRKAWLSSFITNLSGPSLNFLSYKQLGEIYTQEEKDMILKFRLKYAVSDSSFRQYQHIDPATIQKMQSSLPENNFKKRLNALDDYFYSLRSKKR